MPRRNAPAQIKSVEDYRLAEFRERVEHGQSVATQLSDGMSIGVFAILQLAQNGKSMPTRRARSTLQSEKQTENE